ncbi:alanine racemase [bacterium]|nr:alanine racemase [bacterium]
MDERSTINPVKPRLRRRPTHALIDLGALRQNYRALKRLADDRSVMAVVKANAYGHGLKESAQALVDEGVSYFGVGFLEEGIALRRAGIHTPILALVGAVGYQAIHFLEYDLDLTISSLALAKKVAEEVKFFGHKARVHLKIDTGMGRIGVNWKNALEFIEKALQIPELEVVGVYSHFATADDFDPAFTNEQIKRFNQVIKSVDKLDHNIQHFHIANSGALFQHPDSLLNMVRLGISLYGCQPAEETKVPIPLEPVMSLVSEVVYFKRVPQGTPISYGCTWKAAKETTIATVPIGYGDGYARALSNRGEVLIRGKRYPVVGTVCMDQIMINCGDDHVEAGDPVALIGKQGNQRISAEEIAKLLHTIPYEVTTQINTRVPRVFVE